MNIFEYAVKNKLRFNYKGVLTVEDLYDLSVDELDAIYKKLNKEIKQADEESLLKKKTEANTFVTISIDIVKHIVSEKLEEADKRAKARLKREQKQKIMAIMSEKQDEVLKGKSLEELNALLDSMNEE